jgi:hypothetical protein
MPDSWDPQVYRERAQRWREAAEKLPPGETRNAQIALAEGYENLARLIELDRVDMAACNRSGPAQPPPRE